MIHCLSLAMLRSNFSAVSTSPFSQYGGIGIPEALPGESSMPGGGPLQRHLTPEWQKLSMSGVDWASLMQDIQQETAMLIAQQAQQGRADHSVAQRAQQAAVQDAQQAQQVPPPPPGQYGGYYDGQQYGAYPQQGECSPCIL